jgi:hypothetical protein|tara:strand:- start:4956 stop:5255 length:300 start_codon:yes stop_codon:yes gene_type:complete
MHNQTKLASVIWIIVMTSALLFVTSCANKTPAVKNGTEDSTSSISRMGSIADVLGCMFAPDSCPIKSTTEQHKQSDQKIIKQAEEKDWNDVDKANPKSK